MNVWIQRHDFSYEDLGGLTHAEAMKRYSEFDWDSEILKEEDSNAEGIECCNPGMGFVSDDQTILHLVPMSSVAMVHYHFRTSGKFLGLFSTIKNETISVIDYPSEGVRDLIMEHYKGNQNILKDLLYEFGKEV